MRGTAAICMVVLILAMGAAGCSTRLLHRAVEKRLRNRLTTWIGPAKQYSVEIAGTDDADLVLGRLRRFEVSGEDVWIGGVFQIERFSMTLEGVRYTGAQPDFVSIRESSILVEFSEAALNRYLVQRYGPEGVQFEFDDGAATLHTTLRLFGVPVPIAAKGSLGVAAGKQIVLNMTSVDAPKAPLLGPSKELVERQLNPLVDMGEMGVPVRLTELTVMDGRVHLRGVIELPSQATDPVRD